MRLERILLASFLTISAGCAVQMKLPRYSNGKNYTISVNKGILNRSLEDQLLVDNEDYTQRIYQEILITGPEQYINDIVYGLDLIHDKDPQNWIIVRRNITKITLTGSSSIDVDTGRYATNDNKLYGETKEWAASEIIHDAWHRELFRRGEAYKHEGGEKTCLERQNEFFERAGINFRINIEEALKSRYWKKERYW